METLYTWPGRERICAESVSLLAGPRFPISRRRASRPHPPNQTHHPRDRPNLNFDDETQHRQQRTDDQRAEEQAAEARMRELRRAHPNTHAKNSANPNTAAHADAPMASTAATPARGE